MLFYCSRSCSFHVKRGWGDTVNLAARMESSGEINKVNISDSTYQMIKDKFTCMRRGKVEAKNKGGIDMYFVERK